MYKKAILALSTASLLILAGCGDKNTKGGDSATSTTTPAATGDKFSQSFGVLIGENLKNSGLTLEQLKSADFVAGLESAIKGQPLVPLQEANQLVQTKMMELQQAKMQADAEKMNANKGELEKAGKAFLEQNKSKQGVITTPSGLQYEVQKEGKGAKPTLQSTVKVHYHGTLIDGKVFDSSVDRGEPISFPLNGVIQGWQEGVQLMSIGAKYRFYIPHELAYGGQDKGTIPPFSTLIFDVELLEVQ